ncbi:Pkinase Tyr domain containing protein [Trichuris trichiura]|uniref:non-specific protein-tyrosine kinase n=1 Tax=Trichuris trichiura TaxID=36087 RepID=A0A077Z3U0_TRITR|nr:Pkinase Tyr domain containing protein [Trichuris trichiura]
MKDHAQGGHSPLAVYDLLVEADLTAYHSAMQHKLKVSSVDHLRFVTESDLQEIGMSRPEQRRFLKIYQKHFPDSYIGKLRQVHPRKGRKYSKTGQHIIPSESISLCQQLGCGEFASVWQGIWSMSDRSIDKIQVAVKKILPEKMHANPLDFLQEAAIMHRVDHEHIVRFYGVVLNPKSVMLVTELAPLRSLAECLRQPNFREALTVVRLCDYAEQVCSGMAYLEENRLIHRDLAARNILVFSLSQVKVADFGLSRALGAGEEYYHSNISVNLKLPIAWCAPECIVYLRFTSASDIWSFGVTLWEMFTYGFQPWAGLTGQQILDCINVPRSRRLDKPDLCPSDYYNLMLQCWEHEPGNRPKFSSLVSLLPDIRPEQVRAVRSCEDGQSDHLQYKADMVITVLNKRPREYPDGYYWKGVLNTGRAGLFLPETTISLLNSECPSSINGAMLSPSSSSSSSDILNKVLLAKTRPKCPKSNNRPEISAPSSDLRHTGHVGSDGTYFGDVAFLNSGYRDKLPNLAVELADKAMREQNEALRNLANGGSSSSEGVISKGVSSPLSGKKKLYESLLRFKGGEQEVGERPSFCSRLPPEGEVKLSAESEKAYKSMVEEGLACCSASDSAKSCQPKTSKVDQTEEEPGDSLHTLRDDGAAVLRLLRSSSRKPPCVAAPKAVASSFRSECRKGGVPPPVPPRSKERRRSVEDIPSGSEEATKIPPPVPPKGQVISKGNVDALRSQFEKK